MQYSFKNAELKINDKSIVAEEVNFSLSAPIQGVFREGEKDSYEFAPQNGNENVMSVTYLMTGTDPLKTYISAETGIISGNFGGLYFESGYLTSYNFDAAPNFPISVNASIKFFEPLTGTFTPTYNQSTDYKILNINDVTVTGASIGPLDDIDSVSYSFTQNVIPQYVIGESKPKKTLIESKEISMNVKGAHITGVLPPQGLPAHYEITFAHPQISNLTGNYFVNGYISDRTINTRTNSEIKTSFTIKQNYTKKRPRIRSVRATSIYAGQVINITGNDMLNVEKVLFCINGESVPRKEAEFYYISNTAIGVIVPKGASTGAIELRP